MYKNYWKEENGGFATAQAPEERHDVMISDGWTDVEPSGYSQYIQGIEAESSETNPENIRAKRDKMLNNSDWTQVADAPLTETKKTEWATYRQELRDITDQSGYPDSVTWPTKPTGE